MEEREWTERERERETRKVLAGSRGEEEVVFVCGVRDCVGEVMANNF